MAKAAEQGLNGESYWEKYGIERVSIGTVIRVLTMFITHKVTRGVLCLISEAGEGKSQAVHQVARATGRRVVDLRTAFFSLMSGGIPQKAEGGFFQIAVPDYMPKPGEKAILFFDEINQGQNHAIAMFFALLEDRLFFNYSLPEDTIIVCAMNPANSGYMVSKIENLKAFNRRLTKFFMYTPFSDWERHARSDAFHFTDGMAKPCHPWVLKFLQTNRPALYDKTAAEKGQQFACPATWQTVSQRLYMLEQEGVELHGEFARALLAGSIGALTTKELCDYIENNEIRINPEELLQKYKAKSKMRTKVLDLPKKGTGELPELMKGLAAHLFDHKPDVNSVAPQLALFWSDLPHELAQGFYADLSSAAKTNDQASTKVNNLYMAALTKALTAEECWTEVNTRLHTAHDAFGARLKGGNKPTLDPMAA